MIELAAGSRQRGHRAVVVAGTLAEGEDSMEYLAHDLGVPVIHLPALQRELSPCRTRRRCASCRRIMTTRRADILHTHTAKAGATGRIAACVRRRRGRGNRPHVPRPRPRGLLRPAARAGFIQVERLLARRRGDRGGERRGARRSRPPRRRAAEKIAVIPTASTSRGCAAGRAERVRRRARWG